MLKREPRIFVCGYCHLAASLVSFLFRLVVYSIRLMLGPELELMAKLHFLVILLLICYHKKLCISFFDSETHENYRIFRFSDLLRREQRLEVSEGVEDEWKIFTGNVKKIWSIVTSGRKNDILCQVTELFASAENQLKNTALFSMFTIDKN